MLQDKLIALSQANPTYGNEQVENLNLDLEKIFYRPTYISIDLKAFESNVNYISNLVYPSKIAVAVKANAYGHGLVEISKKLDQIGVEMLCVATVEEALCLRENGIATKILLLSEPPIVAISPCLLNDISITAYTPECIDAINSYATPEHKAHVHLKVETGMNRIGVKVDNAIDLARMISDSKNLVLEGVFTHFASAEEPAKPQTLEQIQLFEEVVKKIDEAGLTPKYIHAANSAATFNIESTRFTMVRIGISAYGFYPDGFTSEKDGLKPVLSLKSAISYIKTIKAGESVSYGGEFKTKKDTKIATLPIGYGDGLPRNYGLLGGCVLIHGVKCPIVGRITMDQSMVDVGDLAVNVGDEVTLIGTDGEATISASDWGKLTGTISYEVLCRLNERIPRIYG